MNLITTREAAEIIGVSEVALHKWRKRGTGPKTYPGEGRAKFLYSRAECRRLARERDRYRDIEDRVTWLERAVIALDKRAPAATGER